MLPAGDRTFRPKRHPTTACKPGDLILSVDAAQGAIGQRDGVGVVDGKGPDLVRRLKLSLIAAAVLPTLFFAAAAWIFAARHPQAMLSEWRGELATLAVIALLLGAGLMAVAWVALRRAKQAYARA